MAGIEENVALSGDWLVPSPSPRTFFSAMLGEDLGSRSAAMESGRNNRNNQEPFFLRPQEERFMENSEAMEGTPPSSAGLLSPFSDQKVNLRAGLCERIAARAGFNAPRLNTESIRTSDLLLDSEIKSPFWTIPPGLSPTTLLDSPVFLSNSLVQPSPTTGKLPFFTSDNIMSSSLMSEAGNRSKDHLFSSINTGEFPSIAFKPGDDMRPPFVLGAMALTTHPQPSFPAEASVQSESSLKSHSAELSKPPSNGHGDFSPDQRFFDSIDAGNKHSPPLGERQDEDGEQRATGESVVPNNCGAPSDDGYNWRKYGQKQVKGSEYPRSYYKCTHPNCQVKKKVERSYEGHITEIIYKGEHNHQKPSPNRCNPMQKDMNEQPQSCEADLLWTSLRKGTLAGASDWRNDNPEVTSSASVGPEYVNQSTSLQPQNGSHFEQGDAVDVSSTFSNDEDEEDRGTHGSVSIGHDGEGDESESKRRKIEVYASEMSGASRAIREPRVVVQTTSEVDILDDGYRWRKYGQKVVKGNPNPRSYYKCTAAGCTVRKHVERASHDLKSVITTYEGKHNHDVPAARNSSHMNAPTSGSVAAQAPSTSIQNHGHRPEPSHAHTGMARFDRPPVLGPFGLAGRNQVGPPLPAHGFSYAMNHHPTLPNLALPVVGPPGQVKLPVLPFHPYMAQHGQGEEMRFGMPKGEMKVEPMTEAVYQQIMSRLPLGPHV